MSAPDVGRLDWRTVPVPARMQGLERDPRGLPIPYIVVRGANGEAYFTINDTLKHARCLRRDLCAICGQELLRGRWFVGGPASAFHERGAYIETPTHYECSHFALQVCPYLAAPKYAGRLEDAKFDYAANPNVAMLVDPTMIPDRPPIFVALMAVGQTVEHNGPHIYVKPKEPFRRIEYWRFGRQIPDAEGEEIARIECAKLDQAGREPEARVISRRRQP